MIFFLTLSLFKLDVQAQFLSQVTQLFGSNTAEFMGSMLKSFNEDTPTFNSFAGIFAVVTLLVSASAVFAQLQESLDVIISKEISVSTMSAAELEAVNKVTGLQTIQQFIVSRLFSIGMVVTFMFLSATSLLLSSILSAAVKIEENSPIYLIINGITSIFIFAGMFFLVFRYLPSFRASNRANLYGAITTAFLFVFGKELIGQLASYTLMASSYGAGGSLVILMAWFYYASVIVYVGAEIVGVYEQKI